MKKLPFNLLLLVFWCAPMVIVGEDIPFDSTEVEYMEVESSQMEDYRADHDFLYDRVPPAAESWWESFKRYLWDLFDQLFDQSGISSSWAYIKWLLLIAAVIFIAMTLFKTGIRGLFYAKSASNVVPFITEEEDIHQLAFVDLIAKAMAQKNYKEAIRLSYLSILKQLTDQDLIIWKVDKTNSDYLLELSGAELEEEFKKTSALFEYIWYGDFELDATSFSTTYKEFLDLNNKLGKR